MPNPKKDLLHGPVGRTILELAGPMLFGLSAVLLLNVVDTFFVGQLGARELAAMSFTFPVAILLMSLTFGLGVGVTASVSRSAGKGDRDRVRQLTTHGLLLANLVVALMAGLGLLTIDPVFRALGASPDMILLIREYMVPWYLGVGFVIIPMVGNSAIRATGNTTTPSLIMALAGLVNLVLDPLLIFGIGPFPRLELRGAALATVISWGISFVVALWVLGRREKLLDLRQLVPARILASWQVILRIGMPSVGTQALIPLAVAFLTRMAAEHGPTEVAAYGVGSRVESLGLIGISALTAAIAPFVGQNFGAGRRDRVREALRFCLRACLGYCLVVAVLLALFAVPIARLFNDQPEVIRNITWYLYLIPPSYGLFSLAVLVSSIFNAIHQPIRSSALTLGRLFLLVLPAAMIGSHLGGFPGMLAGVAVANVLAGSIAYRTASRFLDRPGIRDDSVTRGIAVPS